MKRIVIISLAMLAIAAIGSLLALNRMNSFMAAPLNIPAGGSIFEVPPGSSFASVSRRLQTANITPENAWMRLYVRWNKLGGGIQAGEYLIEGGATPKSLLRQFTSGEVKLHAFTLVEGWNRYETLAALQAHDAIKTTLSDEDWPALLESLGATVMNPEGLFLPETYHFARHTSDRTILMQAFELMQSTLQKEWVTRSEDAPVSSPYEALILASIVEKETARADERARIAGVFARRLAIRMRLQTDPTVIYGIGTTFNGDLTRKDMRTDTPYNTYTRGGLPPTPIAMPGQAAIHAVLHPLDGTELFFVATGLGDGSHTFSTTKEQHDAAVGDYLQQLRRNRRLDSKQ